MNSLTFPPCGLCGVRADVGCRHRGRIGPVPQAIGDTKPKPDGRKVRACSPWGKEGNPTQRQFDSLAIAFAASMKPRSKDGK